jgi:8-oxo-dGTP pyrophosphatase MutT (NUDIX family)
MNPSAKKRGSSARDARLKVRLTASAARPVRLSQLRKMRECDQVAAVCYRIRDGQVEFLLVQTRSGKRWTFPKGGAEAGLTHAQAAAIEAFEEAGVHGRIEEFCFVRYASRVGSHSRRPGAKSAFVSAHLCEVLRLCPPKESSRNRTWFSVRATKQKLREGRSRNDGAAFASVVDKAAQRIQNLLSHGKSTQNWEPDFATRNAWNRVHLEALHENFARIENPANLSGWAFTPIQRLPVVPVELVGEAQDEVLQFDRRPLGRPKLLAVAKKFKALSPGARIQ